MVATIVSTPAKKCRQAQYEPPKLRSVYTGSSLAIDRTLIQSRRDGNDIGSQLGDVAPELRANSKLKSSEYSVPTIRLVFLRYATHRFRAAAKELEGTSASKK